MSDLISRQAAIDALKEEEYPCETDYDEGFMAALDKAIWIMGKWLPSAQLDVPDKNVGDMISRQAAIDICANAIDLWHGQLGEGALVAVRDMISELPSAQPEQRWIPCSERLPEEDTEVLISYRYKEGEGDTDHVNIDITSYGTTCFGGREIHTLKEWRQPFDYFHANYEVIAWMPLPTPYREE